MKKKKQPDKKTKEFAVHPFTSLKGFQTDAAVAEEKKAAPKPAAQTAPVDDDALVFLRAVADVKRIQPRKASAGEERKSAPAGKQLAEEERQVFLKEVERLEMDVKFRDELPEDVTPLRPAASSRLRDLKRGAIRIGLELDLHGLTREEALANLARFISGAYNRGQKAVLIITGKGNNSPEEPVLQGAVSGWLRDRGKGMVAEFAPAPRQLGGSGAFVVFLKERKTGEQTEGF